LSGGGGAAPPLQPPAWVEPYDPLPLKGTQVAHGSARFTVLAPALIRMEWSPHTPPRFHDAGTYFAVNRRFAAAPKYEWAIASGVLTITTAALTLRYEPSAGTPGAGFQPSTLSITLADGRVWRSGDEPTGSLHGTIRTLDRVGKTVGLGCTQPAYMNDSHCEEGVVSLDGWAVIDDTMGARWDTTSYRAEAGAGKWPWVTGPAESPAAPPGAKPDAAQCLPTGFSRFECLWGNVVDEAGCRARGCCFDAEAAASAQGVPPAIHMTPWCFWPTPAPGTSGYTDLYFFGHGWDFRGALRDFTGLGGRPPLLPRWALGPFFSRWFAYADHEERAVLAMHARNGIPLDVQVLDTDWHMGWWHAHGFPPHPPRYPEGTPPNAHAIQWTGWDVNEHLLPAVKRLHAHIHARGVATGWNFHLPPYVGFSGGVQYVDSVYKELCAALGLEWEEGEPVLGDYSNKTWSEAFFRVAMVPLLVGLDVDFAWPDWQQGEWTRMLGLAPTPWLSYVFASFPQFTRAPLLAPTGSGSGGGAHQQQHLPSARSHSARSLVLNRWGGLGAHRYPVGFSGDAETTWEVLALQVYITSTAANVAFQWSHDIGGFAGNPDPEIMTRWVQLGVFSPILRPHCAGRGGNSRDIWKFEWNAFEVRFVFRGLWAVVLRVCVCVCLLLLLRVLSVCCFPSPSPTHTLFPI
jgi:alpha-glucosidase (family GH31 glycosyl hydrolase)